ncbi:UROD/MetE-like protein [Trametes elegans]|nr:UROD/MetE-like protein [Trametes elegans]
MAIETSAPPHKRCARAHHIGSLLRPKKLVEKRIAFHSGECTAEEVKALEDEVLPHFVKLQKELGLGVITDGEVRRDVYTQGMYESLDGMTFVPNRPIDEFVPHLPWVQLFNSMGMKQWNSVYCTGKIRRTKPIHVQEFLALKDAVSSEDVPYLKVTICPPTWMHLSHGSAHTYDHSVYANDEEYFADLIHVYREEIKELYEHGCRRIQFDDPGFCFFCSDAMISSMEAAGADYETLLDTYIKVYNAVTADRPADLITGVHTCRGNMKGMHFAEGGYERVARKLFNELDVDEFCLEYDTDRAGGLEPLRYLPAGKQVVLGLVTTKSGELESIEAVKARVRRAAEVMAEGEPRRSYEDALEQLSISPQCGFASVFEGNPITEEEEKEKLALVVEAAKEIWGC